jgi:protein-arginine kinase activator protein McsA
MQITERQHLAKVIGLVRTAKRGWYGMGIGQDLLKCSRCGRSRKALCSPEPSVGLVCSDCYAFVERELDQAAGRRVRA